jgi:hypothetical protein
MAVETGGKAWDRADDEGRTGLGSREGEPWRLRVTVVDHPDHAGWRQLRVSFPARVERRLNIGAAVAALLEVRRP